MRSDDRKNEVRVLLGKKVEALLCPRRKPLSGRSAAPYGHHRLHDVVARSPGIDARVQKHPRAAAVEVVGAAGAHEVVRPIAGGGCRVANGLNGPNFKAYVDLESEKLQ